MRMGIMAVLHTFGSDLKWNPHLHLVVTGGGLSLDGKSWVTTDSRFLMSHKGLKSRWKYQVITRMKRAHRVRKWRFPQSLHFLSEYRFLPGGSSQRASITSGEATGMVECWNDGGMGPGPE